MNIRGIQLVPQLLLKHPDTLYTHCRHIGHLPEEVWCHKNTFRQNDSVLNSVIFYTAFYTPPHKNWRGIMLYPPNFECLSVHPLSIHLYVCPSISASFPCSNFSTVWPIFKLCIDIGIGEEWYGIAGWLISFWKNRVTALDVCQKCFALWFRALTLVPFYRFPSDFA